MCKVFELYERKAYLEDTFFNMNVMTNDTGKIDMTQILRHLQCRAREFELSDNYIQFSVLKANHYLVILTTKIAYENHQKCCLKLNFYFLLCI